MGRPQKQIKTINASMEEVVAVAFLPRKKKRTGKPAVRKPDVRKPLKKI